MKKSTGWLIGIGVAVLMLFGAGIGMSNGLNNAQQNMSQKQGDLQSALQRRNDLIPNLVASTKGSMKNEQAIFGKIAESRKVLNSDASTKEKANASQELSSQGQLLVNVIHESYPQLESNGNVKQLMTQLEGTENRINYARKDYNSSVRTYNQKVSNFPSSMVASMKGMNTKPYFEADDQAKQVPKVDF